MLRQPFISALLEDDGESLSERESRFLAYVVRRHGHGHKDSYVAGCECEPCFAGYTAHNALRRAWTKPASPPSPPASISAPTPKRVFGNSGAEHGTRVRYGDGCRCEPCRRASREYHRAYRSKKRSE